MAHDLLNILTFNFSGAKTCDKSTNNNWPKGQLKRKI